MRVSCLVTLPPEALAESPEEPVTVRVSIQDVTMADESSTTVAETAVEAHSRTDVEGPYELEANLTAGRQYAVYAHVDRSGDGTMVPGDLINTARVPLEADPSGGETHVEVPVQQID